MIASRVPSREEVEEALREKGFEKTSETTETGTFWRHARTSRIVQLPYSVQGFYPSWLLEDIEERIGKLNNWNWMKKKNSKS